MDREYAAHIREDGIVQTISDHLLGTATRARAFGQDFESGEFAWLLGQFHDIGKYSEKFQRRIYGGGNFVDHSTAGAVEIDKTFPRLGYLLSYCIAGHHGGLPDGGSPADTKDTPTLSGRLKRDLEPYEAYRRDFSQELATLGKPFPVRPLEKAGFSLSFYIRMLFSCLVDGDFLDTEAFMTGGSRQGTGESIEVLNDKLDHYIKNMKPPQNEINKKRKEVLNHCILKANDRKGLFSMTVPTGGGKTISSLAFALNHAVWHGMSRVIYVIPYNSIIEQNAAVFKDILGEENVLEHHSDYNFDGAENEGGKDAELAEKFKLAAENWDMPVIVTTAVQFFESLFSNKTSKCRKLHNLTNSVIIFDEAQMIPLNYLFPCVRAIAELVHNYGSSVVLCSATQPNLKKLFPKEIKTNEICEELESLYGFFKRTGIIFAGKLEDQELADRLNKEEQVLCIVNTRKHAQNIFGMLKGEGCYHLSTLMYPLHRKRVLAEIRERLDQSLPCRVVSTSLIEAGVDVDFPAVYRAEAGLDSIIQAAGRCNREGKRQEGPVTVFKPSEKYRKLPDTLRRAAGITDSVVCQFQDVSSPEAISAYFLELYGISGDGIDTKKIVARFEDGLEKGFSFPFAEAASDFRLIENSTKPIIIPVDGEAMELVDRLKSGERNRALMRAVQQYAVNVYEHSYQALYGAGSIQPLDEQLAVLADHSKYDERIGLDVDADTGTGIFV